MGNKKNGIKKTGKGSKATQRSSKTGSRRASRTNPTPKRVTNIQSEIKNGKKIARLQNPAGSTDRKNKNNSKKKTDSGKSTADSKRKSRYDKIRRPKVRKPSIKIFKRKGNDFNQPDEKKIVSSRGPKSTDIVRTKEPIWSFKGEAKAKPRYIRTNLEMRFQELDIVDVQEIDDIDLAYERILPYVKILLRRIRKKREWFSLHLWYTAAEIQSQISTGYAKFSPTPAQQEGALKQLIKELVETHKIYKDFLETFFITGISLRVYDNVQTRKNKKRKPVSRKKR